MSKQSKGVNSNQAALIHELLGEVFETSLRQQLMSGEFSPAMVGQVVKWLQVNNISVSEESDVHLQNLAKAFNGADFDFLNDSSSREI